MNNLEDRLFIQLNANKVEKFIFDALKILLGACLGGEERNRLFHEIIFKIVNLAKCIWFYPWLQKQITQWLVLHSEQNKRKIIFSLHWQFQFWIFWDCSESILILQPAWQILAQSVLELDFHRLNSEKTKQKNLFMLFLWKIIY